jgi:hypothetical protein
VAIITADPGCCAIVAKAAFDLTFVARAQHARLAPQLLRRRLGILGLAFRIWILGIDHNGERGRGRHLAQELKPLWRQSIHEQRDAGNVAAGMVEARDEAVFDRVVADRDDDGDGGSRGLGRQCCDSAARRNDDGDLLTH